MRILLVVAIVLAACTIDVNIDKKTEVQDGREPDTSDASPSLDAAMPNDASPSLDAAMPNDASPPSLDATIDASPGPDAAL